jgi:hypothetical protein
MGLWAKSVAIINSIREHGKQSIRNLADRTGLSKSSVHRHLQAMDRRDRSPESSLWETPGTHLRRDTVIPQWFQASKAAAASDGHAVYC